jgi:hypothetical protein
MLDLHSNCGADAGEGIAHEPKKSASGILPRLTTCLGPRTELAGFVGMICPITSQLKSMRIAARCCLTVGADPGCCSIYAATTTGCEGHPSLPGRMDYQIRPWPQLAHPAPSTRYSFENCCEMHGRSSKLIQA